MLQKFYQSLNEENKKYQKDYDSYEEVSLGKLNDQEKILKNIVLIGISRKFFTHSLPLSAIEECYIWLEDCVRNIISAENSTKKQEKAYETLIKVMEDYNLKILSTKVYWDDIEEKEKFKKLWNNYNEILKIEDKSENKKQKIILFLKDDLKRLYKNKRKNKNIIKLHKNYLIRLGAMKNLQNCCTTWTSTLKGAKVKWNIQK